MLIKKKFIVFILIISVFLPMPKSEAGFDDAINIAIDAASTALSDDDAAISNDVIGQLSDEQKKKQLQNYIEKTRGIIQEKNDFMRNGVGHYIVLVNKIPLVGGLVYSACSNGYTLWYEHLLMEAAETDIEKRFAELREHSIDANQELYDLILDYHLEEKDNENKFLKDVNAIQLISHMYSSHNAIKDIMDAADMQMQDVDTAGIHKL